MKCNDDLSSQCFPALTSLPSLPLPLLPLLNWELEQNWTVNWIKREYSQVKNLMGTAAGGWCFKFQHKYSVKMSVCPGLVSWSRKSSSFFLSFCLNPSRWQVGWDLTNPVQSPAGFLLYSLRLFLVTWIAAPDTQFRSVFVAEEQRASNCASESQRGVMLWSC